MADPAGSPDLPSSAAYWTLDDDRADVDLDPNDDDIDSDEPESGLGFFQGT